MRLKVLSLLQERIHEFDLFLLPPWAYECCAIDLLLERANGGGLRIRKGCTVSALCGTGDLHDSNLKQGA